MRTIFLANLFCLFVSLTVALSSVPVLAESEAASEKPIWLVVTRPKFQEAIKPLEQKRSKDGFETIISTKPVAEAMAALKRRPAFLLLVGDDEPSKQKESWYVPSRRRKLYRWRITQPEEFASDTLWGDFNGDLIPDIPVGRLPVRTTEQLKLVANKIISFENRQPTPHDLRLPMWAGTPGYNPVTDGMATWLLLSTLQREAPRWASPWVISADPMHPLCGWPSDQPRMFTEQLKRGGAMAVLMGHASQKRFHSMNFEGQYIGYSAPDARQTLSVGEPGPATAILTCYSGDFTRHQDCLAESLLLMPGGPVATIAATTESHPLTNYFSGLCLLRRAGQADKYLGSMWLAVQQQAMKARDFIIERMLVDVEGKLEQKMNVAKLRRDQILMYALLGDPATRLYLPDKLEGKIERLNDGWQWQVDKPKDATRLYVGFRPAGQDFPMAELPLQKEAARKRFQQANATFRFEQLAELAADKPWKGKINKEGILRLAAVGPKRIYVVTFDLKSPQE